MLSWRLEGPVQIYDDDGHKGQWYNTEAICPHCGTVWMVVVPLGAEGAECPWCEYVDLWMVWGADEIEEDEQA